MSHIKRLSKIFIYPLVCIFALACFTSTAASADIISTETLIEQQHHADAHDKLASLLARNDVREKLINYGIAPEEASQRVAALTADEAREFAAEIEELPAGGDVVLLLLIIIIILLIR